LKTEKTKQMATSLKKRREKGYNAQIRDILICSKNELAPFATVFSFPPENFERQKFGTIFGIIKVDDHSENSSYVANLLTSVIKKEYFGKTQRSPEESFEAGLRKANLALAELVRHGATSWAGKINFACGAIERNNLFFACLGKASIFLIRGGEIAEISAELEKEKDAESHPLKTFSNASSGKLEIGDKLIFSTHDLTDIFSPEELRQNAAHFSREEFPEFLEISLRSGSELAGTIVVDLSDSLKKRPLVVDFPAVRKGKNSIYPEVEPENAEQPAKKIDSFVGMQDILEPEIRSRDLERILSEEAPISKTFAWKNTIFNFFKKIKSLLLSFFSSANNFARRINYKKLVAYISRGTKHIFSKIGPAFAFLGSNAKKIDWNRKGVSVKIATGIVLLAVASYGIVNFVKNGNEQKKQAEETAVQTDEPAPALQNLEDVNVKNVENFEELAVLGQPASSITLLGNFLFAVLEKSRTVVQIDLNSRNIEETKSDLAVGNFKLAAAMPNLGSLFFLTDDQKIVSFTPINKNFQENGIALPENLKTADIKTFLTYLYLLDPDANQIYRYPRAEGGFGEMQSWLRGGSDVKNAKSFAINDNLFAASPNDITAYLQGKKDEGFGFEKPDVALAIDKIFSEPDMEGIYVLDNKNHRVVKYSKDGKILNQYWSADISSIKDFSVDEKNKIVYLLKGNAIKKFFFE